jgi:hypothetical protein
MHEVVYDPAAMIVGHRLACAARHDAIRYDTIRSCTSVQHRCFGTIAMLLRGSNAPLGFQLSNSARADPR